MRGSVTGRGRTKNRGRAVSEWERQRRSQAEVKEEERCRGGEGRANPAAKNSRDICLVFISGSQSSKVAMATIATAALTSAISTGCSLSLLSSYSLSAQKVKKNTKLTAWQSESEGGQTVAETKLKYGTNCGSAISP